MTRILIPSIALLLAACDTEQSADLSAFDEALAQSQARQAIDDTVAFHYPGAPTDPVMLAEELESFVAEQSDCAEVVQEGDTVSIDFGEEGCDYQDRTWTGALSVRMEEGEDAASLTIEFDGLSDGRVTMDGTAWATLSDTQRDITEDMHLSHSVGCAGEQGPPEGEQGPPEDGMMQGPPPPPAEVDVVGSRTMLPLDGSFDAGVIIDGEQAMSADEGDATMTESALNVRAGELVPGSGSITQNGPMGTAVMTFVRTSDDAVQVTVEGDMGTEVFEVDPVSGERL